MSGLLLSLSLGRRKIRGGKSMSGIGRFNLAQADGGAPTTLAAGSAPGESGVSILSCRFEGGAYFSATPQQHLFWFNLSPQAKYACRIADRELRHEPVTGSFAICPAGCDGAAEVEGSVDALLVAISPDRFALATAEGAATGAQLIETLSGCDAPLFGHARTLALESAAEYPSGPLFWHEAASVFVHCVIARHTSESKGRSPGTLGKDVLARLQDYIVAHLDETIEVAALANIAGRSSFHFSRVFARSVGMTPHRYIVHLRLRQAIALIREGRAGLAEIAARTGFADQSHLWRWVRRVHGSSLTQLYPAPGRRRRHPG